MKADKYFGFLPKTETGNSFIKRVRRSEKELLTRNKKHFLKIPRLSHVNEVIAYADAGPGDPTMRLTIAPT